MERAMRAALLGDHRGAAEPVCPQHDTVIAIIMERLVPILWSSGNGSRLMRRIAVRMVAAAATERLAAVLE